MGTVDKEFQNLLGGGLEIVIIWLAPFQEEFCALRHPDQIEVYLLMLFS